MCVCVCVCVYLWLYYLRDEFEFSVLFLLLFSQYMHIVLILQFIHLINCFLYFPLSPPSLPLSQPSEELSELPLGGAEITKDQRHRGRGGATVSNGNGEGWGGVKEHRDGVTLHKFVRLFMFVCVCNTIGLCLSLSPCLPLVEAELEQMDFMDSSCLEEDEEGRSRRAETTSLSSQFMAYIERRITREVCVCLLCICMYVCVCTYV